VISKKTALEKLGLDPKYNYYLYFGFISPYKGVLELLQKWQMDNKNRLIIAGGLNPNYVNSLFHTNYLKKVKSMARNKNAIITGFVDESDIQNYFCACKFVILPYQTFMSSSGPLSLAFSYSKPIIISRELAAYFSSADIKNELNNLGLIEDDLIFNFKGSKTLSIESYNSNLSKITNFSKNLAEKRSWENIGKQYAKLLK